MTLWIIWLQYFKGTSKAKLKDLTFNERPTITLSNLSGSKKNIQGKCYKSISATMLHCERQIQDDNILEVLKAVARVPPSFCVFYEI